MNYNLAGGCSKSPGSGGATKASQVDGSISLPGVQIVKHNLAAIPKSAVESLLGGKFNQIEAEAETHFHDVLLHIS